MVSNNNYFIVATRKKYEHSTSAPAFIFEKLFELFEEGVGEWMAQ